MKPSDLPPDFRWKYREDLGEGGQGKVWRVSDRDDQIHGAMKIIDLNRPQKAADRFLRDIATVKEITHPSIIRIVDYSKPEDGFDFYVMELVPNAKPLRDLLNTDQNPYSGNPVAAVNLFIQITAALCACEQKGVVHRDISPGNLLVCGDGKGIKVIDFGIAQIEGGKLITLTDSNEGFGTRNYYPPECGRGNAGNIGIWSDLYSAGKILWSALTNQEAFDGEEPVFSNQSLFEIFPEEPSTWHLFDIFEKTIRKDPKERWQNASEAVRQAKKIRGIIKSDLPPFEYQNLYCPICRSDRIRRSDSVSRQIIDREHDAQQIICEKCGYVSFVSRSIRGEESRRRRSLH